MALVLIGALFVLALVTTSAIVFWFFYGLTVLVIVSYFWTRSAANNIRIRRTLTNKWATTGDAIDEEILLSNLGRLPILLVELDDRSNLPGYTASVAENLDGRQTKRWISGGKALRRGLFTLGPMTVRTGDPFGIFLAEFDFPQVSTLVVYPPISVMPDFRIPTGSFFRQYAIQHSKPAGHCRCVKRSGACAGRRNEANPLAFHRSKDDPHGQGIRP